MMTCVSGGSSNTFMALCLVLACALPSNACYTYHAYQVGGPEGRELGNQPGTEWQGKTLHAFAWGAVRQDLPIENCQLGSGQRLGIEEVKVNTNFAYLLASVVTLGIWVPLKVSWRCQRPPVVVDTLGLNIPALDAARRHANGTRPRDAAPRHTLDAIDVLMPNDTTRQLVRADTPTVRAR